MQIIMPWPTSVGHTGMPYVATMPKISEDTETPDEADPEPEVPRRPDRKLSLVSRPADKIERNFSAVQLKTLRHANVRLSGSQLIKFESMRKMNKIDI